MKNFALTLAMLLVIPVLAQDKSEPRPIGPDVNPPKVLEKNEPAYTEEAREARLEGSVLLALTIDAEGKPKDIKVVRALGLGLDEKAIEALGTWKFQAATLKKDNEPVAVRANVEVNFRLL
jgi:periplasmic protein TonB